MLDLMQQPASRGSAPARFLYARQLTGSCENLSGWYQIWTHAARYRPCTGCRAAIAIIVVERPTQRVMAAVREDSRTLASMLPRVPGLSGLLGEVYSVDRYWVSDGLRFVIGGKER
jgi:hypothetical protein